MTNCNHVWHKAKLQLSVSREDAERVRCAPSEIQPDVVEWILSGGDGPDDERNVLTETFFNITLDQCLVCDLLRVNRITKLDDPRDMFSLSQTRL